MANLPLSVVICTYNRAQHLQMALESLQKQEAPEMSYEIIVVDNVSTDNTRAVVQQSGMSNIRYIYEDNQGLSYARNRGWQEAKGNYVAYIDDDVKLPTHWVKTALDIIVHEQPLVFGGSYSAFYTETKPKWFLDRYASRDLGEKARYLGRMDEYLTGGNLFIKRAILQDFGGFNPQLGMSGRIIARGEETLLLDQIRHTFGDNAIYYHPELAICHWVAPYKMQWWGIIRYYFHGGRSYSRMLYLVDGVRAGWGNLSIHFSKTLARLIYGLSIGLLRYDRQQYAFIQNYLYEEVCGKSIYQLGRWYERFRLRFWKAQARHKE